MKQGFWAGGSHVGGCLRASVNAMGALTRLSPEIAQKVAPARGVQPPSQGVSQQGPRGRGRAVHWALYVGKAGRCCSEPVKQAAGLQHTTQTCSNGC